jgi:16S rRNA (uracil1498-N3)-methyltransferase
MQLFITQNFDIFDWLVLIREKRIFDQLRKVLRAKSGYKFAIQDDKIRYFVEFKDFDWWVVSGKIYNFEKLNYNFKNIWVATAFLNKQDKMELICQKLTEIWIEKITFFSAVRSVLKKINDNKINRMKKIILEAAEQAWLKFLPELKIYSDLKDFLNANKDFDFYVADFDWEDITCKLNLDNVYLLIWPEWWWTEKEREFFDENKFKKIKLWETVLRSETASIIWGWIVK